MRIPAAGWRGAWIGFEGIVAGEKVEKQSKMAKKWRKLQESRIGHHSPNPCIKRATEVLAEIARRPGYCYWPITDTWAELIAPFADRIFGHQQVTDAYLLGLAIQNDGVLVTFDRGMKYMAGPEFIKHLLILE